MKNNELKELLFGHIREMFDDANVLQKRQEPSRVQARHRSIGSDSVDYTPFEEVGNQNNDSVRQNNRRTT